MRTLACRAVAHRAYCICSQRKQNEARGKASLVCALLLSLLRSAAPSPHHTTHAHRSLFPTSASRAAHTLRRSLHPFSSLAAAAAAAASKTYNARRPPRAAPHVPPRPPSEPRVRRFASSRAPRLGLAYHIRARRPPVPHASISSHHPDEPAVRTAPLMSAADSPAAASRASRTTGTSTEDNERAFQ